jgi:hypothetical protein
MQMAPSILPRTGAKATQVATGAFSNGSQIFGVAGVKPPTEKF